MTITQSIFVCVNTWDHVVKWWSDCIEYLNCVWCVVEAMYACTKIMEDILIMTHFGVVCFEYKI